MRYGDFLVGKGLKEQALVYMTDSGNDRRCGVRYLLQDIYCVKCLDAGTAATYHREGIEASSVNLLYIGRERCGIAEGLLFLGEVDIRGSCIKTCTEVACRYGRACEDKEDLRTVSLEEDVLKYCVDVLETCLVLAETDLLTLKVFLGHELVLDYLDTGYVKQNLNVAVVVDRKLNHAADIDKAVGLEL